jgi:DNA polymerase kappa
LLRRGPLPTSSHLTPPPTQVSEIIYNASKGSKFFNNEEAKDKVLTEKIARILARKRQLEKLDLASDLRRADDYIAELELSRDLSQTVVHIDCDAFYAAVEELDRPELKTVPMAVGKGVLTTCNYLARKYGCRSGMAGFVAKKLCPQLICLPLNFDKYIAKAKEIRAVLARYDDRFESASIDEAYLNITEYCTTHEMDPWDVVMQLRAEVFEEAKVTVSAGIAANAKLAKICSNRNKPNGQFRLASDRQTIMAFMSELSTRKVNGIGRVMERELKAIGIETCGQLYAERMYLPRLFGEKAFQFLIQCYLGLGRTKIQPAEEYERKSVGTESTFGDMSAPEELRKKLRQTAEELEGDLERTQHKGRTLVLKVKLHTYEVLTRQTAPPFAVHKAADLYKYALPMLARLERERPGLKLRLMGLRVTHIVSTKKAGIDFFGAHGKRASTPSRTTTTTRTADDDGEWETWPEAEFEEAARNERHAEMNELEALSQEAAAAADDATETEDPHDGRPEPAAKEAPTEEAEVEEEEPAPQRWNCPVCFVPQPAVDRDFNDHVDFCLSRQTIREAVRDGDSEPPPPRPSSAAASSRPAAASKKRSRKESATASGSDKRQRALFFS